MEKIHVSLKKEIDDSYDILIESGFFDNISKDLSENSICDTFAVITDSNVKKIYGQKLVNGLKNEDLKVCLIDFNAGETSKNLETAKYLINTLIKNKLDRKSAIIALGGGVVGDIAGFIASIYMRGIPYFQIPTTLMSQVDSSIGGKTAVDLDEGKNLIGTFHHPEKVYIDPKLLVSLSEREFKNGIAEIIKYGVIYDRNLFEELEDNINDIKRQNIERLTNIIFKSCQIKSEIVQQDDKEKNLRSILNYGHTFGHAEEKCGQYAKSLHGEAVAIGMNFAGLLAMRKDFLKKEDLQRQNDLINSFNLPLKSEYKPNILINAMYHDKKVESGKINFVLPESIGKMIVVNGKYRIPVSKNELFKVFNELNLENWKIR